MVENFKGGRNPGKDFFITVKPDVALNEVVRPRTTDLLRLTRTTLGEVFVWCTFSHDQVDLNFKNPAVLLEFLKIIRRYLETSYFLVQARRGRVPLERVRYLMYQSPEDPLDHQVDPVTG